MVPNTTAFILSGLSAFSLLRTVGSSFVEAEAESVSVKINNRSYPKVADKSTAVL